MKNLLYLFILLTFASGCTKEQVIDVPIDILFDHPLKPDALQSDPTLSELLSPFESKVGKDSLYCLNFKLVRIDVIVPPVVDSLTKKDGWIGDFQNWMLGGKKNAKKYRSNLVKGIRNKNIIPSFGVAGDTANINKYFANNKLRIAIFTANSVAYERYKSLNCIVFNSVDSIRLFIKQHLNQSPKIAILYEPVNNYQNNNQIKFVSKPENKNSEKLSVVDTGKFIPNVNSPAPQIMKTVVSTLTQKECDARVAICLKEMDKFKKINFFFDEIFQFVNSSINTTNEYRQLLGEIANILVASFPRRGPNGDENLAYNYACSYKTGFLEALRDQKKNSTSNQLEKIYNSSCPL